LKKNVTVRNYAMKEICYNLWHYISTEQNITGISARAYFLNGSDNEKCVVLETLSRHDYKLVPIYGLPTEVIERYADNNEIWYGLLKQLGIEVVYKEVFEHIEKEFPNKVETNEEKFFFDTPLYNFENGFVPTEIGNGFIKEKYPN
jgi:hypothetical protein